MVRPRIQLERLNGLLSRDDYYFQNSFVISNKVMEMSTLTGTNVMFLAFSPRGYPTLNLGVHSNLMNIMRRFADVAPDDREKRRHDNIQTLRANYQKAEYNIEVEEIFEAWKQERMEGMQEEYVRLNQELNELTRINSYLKSSKTSLDIHKIRELEKSLENSLDVVLKRKEEITMRQKAISQSPTDDSNIDQFEDKKVPNSLRRDDSEEWLAYAGMLLAGSGNNGASSSQAPQQE